MHSIGIVQWNSTRRDHPGNPGRVYRSGLVNWAPELLGSVATCFFLSCCTLRTELLGS